MAQRQQSSQSHFIELRLCFKDKKHKKLLYKKLVLERTNGSGTFSSQAMEVKKFITFFFSFCTTISKMLQ